MLWMSHLKPHMYYDPRWWLASLMNPITKVHSLNIFKIPNRQKYLNPGRSKKIVYTPWSLPSLQEHQKDLRPPKEKYLNIINLKNDVDREQTWAQGVHKKRNPMIPSWWKPEDWTKKEKFDEMIVHSPPLTYKMFNYY